MGLFSPILGATVGATVRVFIRELRATRKVLQDGIDTYRVVKGLPPLYTPMEPPVENTEEGLLAKRRPIVGTGDFLSRQLLEDLAMEQGIRITPDLDLEALARDRGWVDDSGKFLLLPHSVIGQDIDPDTLNALMSEAP